jgi:hypothetical protein
MHLTLPVASTVAVAFAAINLEIRRPNFYRPEEDRDADTQPIGYSAKATPARPACDAPILPPVKQRTV